MLHTHDHGSFPGKGLQTAGQERKEVGLMGDEEEERGRGRGEEEEEEGSERSRQDPTLTRSATLMLPRPDRGRH